MKRAKLALCAWLLACAAGSAFAGSSLSLRLVEANNSGAGVSGELTDVAGLLRDNLPFNTFHLASARALKLPAGGEIALGRGFVAHCDGPQHSLTIRVARDGKPILKATVELRDGTPLILGGFPTEGGKLILVLLAQ
jgi:hypothetical protein